MERAVDSTRRSDLSRLDLLLTLVAIPVAGCLLAGGGLALLNRYRDGHMTLSGDAAVAFTAAALGVGLTLWWLGGMSLALAGALARALRWRGVEQWATRRAPRTMVRAVGAMLGIHLVTVSAAHATEPVTPFWTETDGGTEQTDSPVAPQTARDVPAPPTPTATELQVPAPIFPADAATPATGPVPAAHRVVDGKLTVVEGDTLWDLTAQLLGFPADVSAVSAGVGAWLSHNDLAFEGNLIRPGDQLHVPPAFLTATASPTHQGATP